VLGRIGVLALAASERLLGAVEPVAGERLAVRELADAVEPRPFPEVGLLESYSGSGVGKKAWLEGRRDAGGPRRACRVGL